MPQNHSFSAKSLGQERFFLKEKWSTLKDFQNKTKGPEGEPLYCQSEQIINHHKPYGKICSQAHNMHKHKEVKYTPDQNFNTS